MIKTICFFIETPLDKRDYKRFGVDILKSRGFEVIFLDMTRFLHPDYLLKYQPPDLCSYPNIVTVEIKDDVLTYLENNRHIFGIDLMGLRKDNMFFYSAFKKYDIDYAILSTNSNPLHENENSKRSNKFIVILNAIRSGKFLSIGKKIINRIYMFCLLQRIQQPRIIFAGGRILSRSIPDIWGGIKIVWVHAFDYDLYLEYLQKQKSYADFDYCVFLDEYLPFHPDVLLGAAPDYPVEVDEYYNGLDKFFNYIESKFGISVVIAANPRSQYELKPDYFRGRKVIKGKTIELVAQSKFVLTHASTSINYAVLFNKPILFLTSDKIDNSPYGLFIKKFAKQFNKDHVNLDRNYDLDNSEFQINKDIYTKYYTNYIKIPGTPEKPFWDIVADYLLKENV